MKYHLGGYYLIKLRDNEVLFPDKKEIYTCSTCINDSLLDGWSISWVKTTTRELREAAENFSLNSEGIQAIHTWTDEKFEKSIGWLEVFYDLDAVNEYKSFFKGLGERVKTLGIYFTEDEAAELLKEFAVEGRSDSSFGIEALLKRNIQETSDGDFIGYDLIGIELGGNFHSFHCHSMAEELKAKFGVVINGHGLIQTCNDWQALVAHMNDDETGCEPVPWFLVKVKLFG